MEQTLIKNSLQRKGLEEISMKEIMDEAEKLRALPEGKNKESLKKDFLRIFENVGANFLELALDDGTITEEEITRWTKKYSVTKEEIGELVKPGYMNGFSLDTKSKKETVILITVPNSGPYRMRHLAVRRFGVKVITHIEFCDRLISGVIPCPPGMEEALEELKKEREKQK